MWHSVGKVECTAAGEIAAEIEVPPESAWFEGHFPGDPILPGIAQLGILHEILCHACGPRTGIAGFSRVKFRRIIRPRELLAVSIAPRREREGSFAFRILVGGEIACSGNLELRKSESEG